MNMPRNLSTKDRAPYIPMAKARGFTAHFDKAETRKER